MHPVKKHSTSWQPVSKWYSAAVGEDGHYYHQHIVLPESLLLLGLKKGDALLDLACGQGVLARKIPDGVYYQGLDIASSLIATAKKESTHDDDHFAVADVSRSTLPLQKKDFTHAAIILAIQNIDDPRQTFFNAARHLQSGGKLLIVMNHPCFRIPRQSSWVVDEKNKTQYRRIDRYLSSQKIPITAHPSKKTSAVTWSFHEPLSAYTKMLHDSGFVIEVLDEWSSDKSSVGKAAKMENRSRQEIPLFLTILATLKKK